MNNMTVRILVAVIAGPVILYLPYLGLSYFAAFIFVISFLGSKEILNFFRSKHIKLTKLSPYLVSLIPLFFFSRGLSGAAEYSIVIFTVLFVAEVFRKNEKPAFIVSGYLLMGIYCGLFPAMLIGAVDKTSPSMFLFIYGVIIATDSFAYFGGMACSKMFRTHKLLERVSPKKTVEGSVSGLIFAVTAGYFIAENTDIKNFFDTKTVLILSAVISVLGQAGDLFESKLKRDFNFKDSSKIIPGHGGILDRFDSLIFISPAVYIFVTYFVN
ncbi:MAG: phosphatidate cytidylyltransferase [Candidatus Delongbacteria bacterium]|jgi:phosphatidate cytidylyltransferase|nr:phosphatidate cytidylyltransferase [Candidatus Delongbacteria bacterium]MDD4205126.1 phosphatidate cytidylyltransferase [Candidatus Delongbacteria bacterium]MDY0017381.1 phosphatidate cytidylyltransferase [Candidatus Delongbacteria bacterium]